ncbi:MAG TPA: DUF1269 domain-containing protein [Chloroflexota bacterium]|nr:DUF1269 domain-containing protein [Chloroflexota bacterium]
MSETPVQVIVAAYPTPDGAARRMAELQEARKEGLVGIIDMAVVVKDGEGKLKITNSRRRSTRGLVTGGVVGGLVGLLAGPVGWVALGGGAIGALAGKVRGAPLKRELQDLGESLTPNSSAIVAVVEHTWVTDLQRQLAAEGAQVVHDELKADIAAQLEAGGSVLYTAVGTGAGGAIARVTEKEGQTSATVIAADDDGVYIEQATLTDEEPTTETPAITAAPSPSASAETEAKPAAPPAGESGSKQP